jgi:hypothetical protein
MRGITLTSSPGSTGGEPIVLMTEGDVSPEETVLIVRHLERQGFAVEVCSLEPFELLVTCPSAIETE